MRRWVSTLDDVVLVVALVVAAWWGYDTLRPAPHHVIDQPVTRRTAAPDRAPATLAASPPMQALLTLMVKGRAPKTGYTRDQFGHGWLDPDRNGCDTRNDMLRRDLTEVVLKPGTHGCVVLSGTLADPYLGQPISFVKGNTTSTLVQIDHVVALSDAWQKGAQQWDQETRQRFANDPANLLAVSGSANQAKGDGDAATWLPKNKAFRCSYVSRQVAVKASYRLWVTEPERAAMARVLSTCPSASR